MREVGSRLSIYFLISCTTVISGCNSLNVVNNWSAKNGSEVRYIAKIVLAELKSCCKITSDLRLLKKYEPLRARYNNLLKTAKSSSHATDFEIAEADDAFLRKTIIVECAEPDKEDFSGKTVDISFEQHLDQISENIKKLEMLVNQKS